MVADYTASSQAYWNPDSFRVTSHLRRWENELGQRTWRHRRGDQPVVERARIEVRVVPRSNRNEVEVSADGWIKVRVTASPTDGQANRAVCELLAKKLGVSKSAVSIVRGEASRDKSLSILGLSESEARTRLAS